MSYEPKYQSVNRFRRAHLTATPQRQEPSATPATCQHCAAGAIRIRRHGTLQHLANISGTAAWWDCTAPQCEEIPAADLVRVRDAAAALLARIDNLTTDEFQLGGERKEREALRVALGVK